MKSKTLVITGASTGIGRALAERMAVLGHRVIAVARTETALQTLKQLHPDNIEIVVADITDNDDQLKITKALKSDDKGVFLINNAGIALPKLLENMTEDEWDKHYLINARAPIFLTKKMLPNLLGGGRVLNISTALAHNAMVAMSAYGISKATLYHWKEYSNAELNDKGILFGSAMPGVVDTPIQDSLRACAPEDFPAVGMFKGFYDRKELLSPSIAARFLSWLLLDTKDNEFIKGDWDIYDESHHQYWAESGTLTGVNR